MVGAYHISIQNAVVKYEFEVRRNITIIKGDSATGKTVLVDLVRDYVLNGKESGVSLSCSIPCRVIEGNTWEDQLSTISGAIVFIDEGNSFISSDCFSKYVKAGQNYYVIITRESLSNLPYSVTEIYGIKSSGRYDSLEPVYHETFHIYEDYSHNLERGDLISPTSIITEDSNSGYDFFCSVVEAAGSDIKCASADGKSNIFQAVSASDGQSVLIIADGAAFGAEMERICELRRTVTGLSLFLPESFEWLILDTGLVKDITKNEIYHAENYADSTLYFSWEQYFTHILTEKTKNTFMAYRKSSLSNYYKNPTIIKKVLEHIKGIDFGKGD